MTRIDPTSSEYQVSPKFNPDKEATHAYPMEKEGWVRSHDSLRLEMRSIRQALQAVQNRKTKLQAWEIASIYTIIQKVHLVHVDSHHKNEDNVFVPELRKRFKYPDKLETDHEGLIQQLARIEILVDGLQQGGKVDDLLDEWMVYESMMRPHLKEEEEIAVPLMRAYFTNKDLRGAHMKMFQNSPAIELGSFIHAMTPSVFRTEFMVQKGIPSFAWHIYFQFKYKKFQRDFVRHVECLQVGLPPMEKRSCLIC